MKRTELAAKDFRFNYLGNDSHGELHIKIFEARFNHSKMFAKVAFYKARLSAAHILAIGLINQLLKTEILNWQVLDPIYGFYVWPCAPVLASYLVKNADIIKDKNILEVNNSLRD